mmetsp:Transcript_11244/g.35670  ORF Transcript_11244/g.35670 Transcript_11244/m.35670 type:complete len:259 (-) Transcript_11244:235-1011(-)
MREAGPVATPGCSSSKSACCGSGVVKGSGCIYGKRGAGLEWAKGKGKRARRMAACEVQSPADDESSEGLRASEQAEMHARARVIARKVWFLRHAALCLEPKRCRLGPCAKAVELVTHMRSCGAIADPCRGCGAPACAHAARLLHHPRTCTRGAQCAVCAMVRRAGSSGKGLLLRKDVRQESPEASGSTDDDERPRKVRFKLPASQVVVATSLPTDYPSSATSHRPRALSQGASQHLDADGFAVPEPRVPSRKRSPDSR